MIAAVGGLEDHAVHFSIPGADRRIHDIPRGVGGIDRHGIDALRRAVVIQRGDPFFGGFVPAVHPADISPEIHDVLHLRVNDQARDIPAAADDDLTPFVGIGIVGPRGR